MKHTRKTDNLQSRAVGARLSNAQYAVLLRVLGDETTTDYVRRLIAEDMARRGVAWPEHEFIANEDRAEKGVPWLEKKSGKSPKK